MATPLNKVLWAVLAAFNAAAYANSHNPLSLGLGVFSGLIIIALPTKV